MAYYQRTFYQWQFPRQTYQPTYHNPHVNSRRVSWQQLGEDRLDPSLLGGYDEAFVNAVEDDLLCSICKLPLKDPVQTKCGHRFCKTCLDEHCTRLEQTRQRPNCPVDRNWLQLNEIFADKATERKILSFYIRCPSEDCQWTGELRSKDEHLTVCPDQIVPCTNPNCPEAMKRNCLETHMTTTFPWRIVRCDYCNVSYPECKTKDHQAACTRFPLDCEQSCGAVIPREMGLSHIQKDCPLTIISCPYSHMGCTAEIERKEVESHLDSAMRHHFDMACAQLSRTQSCLGWAYGQINDLQAKLQALEQRVSFLE